jgi:predicted RNA binding protein YcfA (HicA-like mRNA interferase family)
MSNVPSYTPVEVVKILKKMGFILDRTSGSHQVWIHELNHLRVVVPMQKRDLPKGTFYAILRQAGIDKRDI